MNVYIRYVDCIKLFVNNVGVSVRHWLSVAVATCGLSLKCIHKLNEGFYVHYSCLTDFDIHYSHEKKKKEKKIEKMESF